jgi:hypothetical protein
MRADVIKIFFLPSSGRMTFFSLAILALQWRSAVKAVWAPEAVAYV